MPELVLRVNVEDFATWKQAHDRFTDLRRTYGMTDLGVYRDAADAHRVVVMLACESLEKALPYFSSKELREASAQAGVRGPREGWVAERRW